MKMERLTRWLHILMIVVILGGVIALMMAGVALFTDIVGYTLSNAAWDAFELGGMSEPLFYSRSPGGTYLLLVQRVEPVDGSAACLYVCRVETDGQHFVYYGQDADTPQISWLTNELVSINGKCLDLSHGERYDWRTP